jgi:aminopeptidase N
MYNGRIFIDRTIKNNYFQIGVRSLFRADSNDRAYLLYPDEWSLSTSKNSPWLNNAVSFLYRNYQWYKNGGNTLDLSFRSAAFTDDFNFSKITLCNVNSQKIGKLNLKTRLFGQLGFGEDWPIESMLYLAGANPEEMMDNKFSRSVGFVDRTWLGYGIETNHFQMGGGLNLRGYAGYLGAEEDEDGNVMAIYKGNTGCAINAELEFDKLIPIRPRFIRDFVKIKSYLFGDAGMINISEPDELLQMADVRIDAGLGFALSIKNWGPFDRVKPFTIRFDMPFFLNRIPAVEKDYLMFRYVVGINRAF